MARMTKPSAEFGVAETFRFERRIGADECVHGENDIGRMAFGGQAIGQLRGADQTLFFSCGPDEGDVAIFQWRAERPDRGDRGGVADAIVETAAVGARSEQRPIFAWGS